MTDLSRLGPLSPLAPLADPVYRRLFLAQVIALMGTGLSTVALSLLAFDLAGGDAGKALGTALALKMVAYVVISPLAGAVADRLPRKTLLVCLDAGRALCIGLLPWVSELWQIYVLIFLLSACAAGFTPTFQALIPAVLPDDKRYTRALALSRLAYDLENLLSPMLAALALVFVTYSSLFIGNAFAFVASALLIVSTQLPHVPGQRGEIESTVVMGFRAYFRTPRLRALLALSMAAALGGAMVIVNTVVYVQGSLELGATSTAIALAAFGTGSMLVALVLPAWLDQLPDRPFMCGGAAITVCGLALMLTQPGFTILLCIWLLLGVGTSLIQTPSARLLNRSCTAANRTALFAAQFSLSHLCWLTAYLTAGWASDMQGAALWLSGGAFAVMLLALWFWRGSDSSQLFHHHAPIEHDHVHMHDAHHQHQHDGSEGPEPHRHVHAHGALSHSHDFVIDLHHTHWPIPR